MRVTSSGQSPLLFLNIIKILKKFNVRYMIIGAFAASFYGVIRASLDVDALIGIKDIKLDMSQLIDELKKNGYNVEFRMGDFDDPVGGLIRIKDKNNNYVDLLMNIKGCGDDLFTRSVSASFKGQKIQIVGLEDFIVMKLLAGSVQDLEDVKGVLYVSNQRINQKLLNELIQKQNTAIQKLFERILNE